MRKARRANRQALAAAAGRKRNPKPGLMRNSKDIEEKLYPVVEQACLELHAELGMQPPVITGEKPVERWQSLVNGLRPNKDMFIAFGLMAVALTNIGGWLLTKRMWPDAELADAEGMFRFLQIPHPPEHYLAMDEAEMLSEIRRHMVDRAVRQYHFERQREREIQEVVRLIAEENRKLTKGRQ